MRILSYDIPGAGAAINLTTALTTGGGGYTIPHPALAYHIIFVESAQGATAARLGGADVSASRGVPFAAALDKVTLPIVLGAGFSPSRVWNMDIIFLYIPAGDTVSVSAWVD